MEVWYIFVGDSLLWLQHLVFQLAKLDCEYKKQCVQDCSAAAFDGLVLLKEVEQYLIFGACGEKDDWCKPERGKLYQKILLCWGNDFK